MDSGATALRVPRQRGIVARSVVAGRLGEPREGCDLLPDALVVCEPEHDRAQIVSVGRPENADSLNPLANLQWAIEAPPSHPLRIGQDEIQFLMLAFIGASRGQSRPSVSLVGTGREHSLLPICRKRRGFDAQANLAVGVAQRTRLSVPATK
jgi:hypothetical protein